MPEKREHKRITLDILGDIVFSSPIRIINISAKGALVEHSKRLDINKKMKIAVSVEGTPLILKGIIVRSSIVRLEKNKRGESQPVYQAGLEFDEELTEQEKAILSGQL